MSNPDQQPADKIDPRTTEIYIDGPTVDGERARLFHLLLEKFGNFVSWSDGPNGIEVCDSDGKTVARGKDLYEILGIKHPEEIKELYRAGYEELLGRMQTVRLKFLNVLQYINSQTELAADSTKVLNELRKYLLLITGTAITKKIRAIDEVIELYTRKISMISSPAFMQIISRVEEALNKDKVVAGRNVEFLNYELSTFSNSLNQAGFDIPTQDPQPPEKFKN